jgi:hypothetical protein
VRDVFESACCLLSEMVSFGSCFGSRHRLQSIDICHLRLPMDAARSRILDHCFVRERQVK